MRARLLAPIFALLGLTATSLLADAPPAPDLSLEDSVALALAKNFDLKIQRISRDGAKDSLIIADANFDPTFGASTSRAFSQSLSNTSQSSTDTRLTASKKILTGATLSASTSLDRLHSRPDTTSTNPSYNSDISFSVRQPLLKNAGIASNRAAIDRAKLGVTRASHDFKSSVLTTIRNVETAYYNLVFAREQLTLRRFSLELAEQLLADNKIFLEKGSITELDVLQAKVGIATARSALIQAEQTVRNNEDSLTALINPFDFATTPGSVALPATHETKVSFDRSYKLARDQAPDLASTQLSIEQLKLDALTAKKNQLPTLDVGAALGYNAKENTPARATSELLGSDGYNWQLDATLNIPWGLRADKARYRQALNSLNRAQLGLQQTDQALLVQVRASIRSVETNEENIQLSALASQLSEEQFRREKERFDAGLSTFRRVQESKEDLDTARIKEIQARIALHNALADLAKLETSSLTHYKVSLE